MRRVFIALPVALIFLAGCSQPAAVQNQSENNGSSPDASVQKFSDAPYFENSYLISGDTLNAEAQKALAGFQLDRKSLPDGTTQITLKAQESGYYDQQYILQSGENLYFIEKSWGDDQGGKETNIKDDTAVVVDGQGNIVQPPLDFSK